MSNELNRIYSFLAGFGGENAWRYAADQNGDKAITINEFRSLIDSEWDTDSLGNVPDNDLINNFFRKFDDNKSGANKDRIRTENGSISNLYAWSAAEYNDEEMQANVEKFVEINKALNSTSVKNAMMTLLDCIENGSEQAQCKTSIINYLSNALANDYDTYKNNLEDSATTILNNDISLKKVVAEHIADDLRIKWCGAGTIAESLKGFYDIFDDKDLQNIINNSISQYNGTADLKVFKSQLDAKIYQYLTTASVGRHEGDNISDETQPLSTGGLNTIQMAKMEKRIHDAISTATIPEGYLAYDLKTYEKAITDFIKNSSYFNNQDYLTNLSSETKVDDFFGSKAAESVKKSNNTNNTDNTIDGPDGNNESGENNNEGLLSNIKDSYILTLGGVTTINLPKTMEYNGKRITTDEINYTASGNGVNINNNKITINPTEDGVFKGSVSIYINNVLVETKTFEIEVYEQLDGDNICKGIKNWSGNDLESVNALGFDENDNLITTPACNNNFDDLYYNNSVICLGYYEDDSTTNWTQTGKNLIKDKLTDLGEAVVNTIAKTHPSLDKTALSKAMEIVVARYIANGSNENINSYIKGKYTDTQKAAFDHINKFEDLEAVILVKEISDENYSNFYGITFGTFVDAILEEYTYTSRKVPDGYETQLKNIDKPFPTDRTIQNALTDGVTTGGLELSGFKNLVDAKSTAITQVQKLIDELASVLINAGMYEPQVEWAAITAKNFYVAAINGMYDRQNTKGGDSNESLVFKYNNADGKEIGYSGTFHQFTTKYESNVDYTGGNAIRTMTSETNGLCLEESWNTDINTYTIAVNLKHFLKVFQGFLDAYIG